jgi:tetratricopeptide (TPR) repeat protein
MNPKQRKKLLELFVSEYPRFSILLLEYERWHEENKVLSTRGQLLNKMLTERKLTNRVDEVLAVYDFSTRDLESPSLAEEEKIADAFPSHPFENEKRQARRVDARALLILRNINRLLEPRGARLVLITRDLKSPAVAEQLAKEQWFDWTGVRKYFCDIESVYLDLILHPLKDEEKLRWLENADEELSKMANSVEQLIEEFRPENTPLSSVRELSTSVRELLKRNSQNWDKLVDMEFIRVSPEIGWLGEDFVRKQLFSSPVVDEETTPKMEASTSSLLLKIVDLVDSPTVQELASEDVGILWENISADVYEMKWLSQFSGDLSEALNDLRELLSKPYDDPGAFETVVARSKSFTNMPDIHFRNKDYASFVNDFRPWTYSKEQLVDEVGLKLSRLFSQAAAQMEKPESCLFMAFILGMLDNWGQAIKMAEHGRGLLSKEKVNPEFNYFLASAVFQDIKKRGENDRYALEQYVWAIELMWEALHENPPDPRYLNRQGTLALECHFLLRKLNDLGEVLPEKILNNETNISSEQEALGFLEQALKKAGNDRKLRVRILNNLAYSYGTLEQPNLEKAEHFHNQVIDELRGVKQNKNDTLPEFEKWQFVMDTRWYIGAKISYFKKDVVELENNIENLVLLHQKASLNDSDRKFIKSHLNETREWLLDLKRSQVKQT